MDASAGPLTTARGGVCLPIPAARPPVVSPAAGADCLGSRSGASDQGPDDAGDDAPTAVVMDEYAQAKSGR